jgi:hypothetical protein
VLRPLAEMAAKYRIAVLSVTPAQEQRRRRRPAGHRLAGLARGARRLFQMRDEHSKDRRLFLTKNNLGIDTTGFAYSIDSLRCRSGLAHRLGEGTITGTVDDEIARRHTQKTRLRKWRSNGSGAARGRAVEVEVIRLPPRRTDYWRTVQRAAKDIGLITTKTVYRGSWEWSLP